MLLIGVKENNGWIESRWILTYRVAWKQLLKACSFVEPYYEQFEVLADDQPVHAKHSRDYMRIKESGRLTIRGVSKVIQVPLSITFYNQLSDVDVRVAMQNEEFSKADYEAFNKSMSQYLNSIELAIHRKESLF